MSGRRTLLLATTLSIAVLAVIAVVVLIVPRDDGSDVRIAPAVAMERVWLVAVPGGVAAYSAFHGPRLSVDGRASGFSHDALGAALAATNISARVTAAADPEVSRVTLAEQCWGAVSAVSLGLATALPRPDVAGRPDLAPRALYHRIIAGDPGGEYAVVSLLADTEQARRQGGLARLDLTVRWSGQDWSLRVPVGRASVQALSAEYTLLGPTP